MNLAISSTTELIKLLALSGYEESVWALCSPEQAEWLLAEGLSYCPQPLLKADVWLGSGGPAFLLTFLKIVNPALPFENIKEVDLEHLIQELDPVLDLRFHQETLTWDMVERAWEKTPDWFPETSLYGTLALVLQERVDRDAHQTRSTLAALRLASFHYRNRVKFVVVDRWKAIDHFVNSFEDGSGMTHYLFKVAALEHDWRT